MADLPGFLGSAVSAVGSFLGARSANRTNRAISREQMGFQESMSSTAYQRAMEDMRKAGLNPILAYQQGGASSPAGASIPSQDSLSPAVNSGMAAMRLKADLDNIREMTSKLKSDQVLNQALAGSAHADALLKVNSAKVAGANEKLLNYQLPAAKNQADMAKTPMGRVLDAADRAAKSIGNFFGMIKPVGR